MKHYHSAYDVTSRRTRESSNDVTMRTREYSGKPGWNTNTKTSPQFVPRYLISSPSPGPSRRRVASSGWNSSTRSPDYSPEISALSGHRPNYYTTYNTHTGDKPRSRPTSPAWNSSTKPLRLISPTCSDTIEGYTPPVSPEQYLSRSTSPRYSPQRWVTTSNSPPRVFTSSPVRVRTRSNNGRTRSHSGYRFKHHSGSRHHSASSDCRTRSREPSDNKPRWNSSPVPISQSTPDITLSSLEPYDAPLTSPISPRSGFLYYKHSGKKRLCEDCYIPPLSQQLPSTLPRSPVTSRATSPTSPVRWDSSPQPCTFSPVRWDSSPQPCTKPLPHSTSHVSPQMKPHTPHEKDYHSSEPLTTSYFPNITQTRSEVRSSTVELPALSSNIGRQSNTEIPLLSSNDRIAAHITRLQAQNVEAAQSLDDIPDASLDNRTHSLSKSP